MSSFVHLDKADFHVLVLWCERDSSCVGARQEDQSFGRCFKSSHRISDDVSSSWERRLKHTSWNREDTTAKATFNTECSTSFREM